MRMTRVFVDAALEPGRELELPAVAALHLTKVLRAGSGDAFTLFGGDGCEYPATITAVRGARVSAVVGAGRAVDRESPLAVTLVQGVPRGERMDLIVQKATELGVRRIVPVLSQRSVVRLDGEKAHARAQHWRAVAISACEQCGRNRLPDIESPRPLLEVLGGAPGTGVRLLLDPDAPASAAPAPLGAVAEAAEVAVGPEGGFTPAELEAFALARYVPVRLGPRVLRAETAAIVALAWLQSRFGDLRDR